VNQPIHSTFRSTNSRFTWKVPKI